jgi:hypothetical protein
MSVRDEREKLKRVSPLLITTELLPSMDQEQVEYTREDGFIDKVLLRTHAAESLEQVLYCLTEFNLTAVRTITIKTVATISVVYTQQSWPLQPLWFFYSYSTG